MRTRPFPDDLVSLSVDDVECFADNDIEVYSKADGSAITLRHDVFFAAAALDYPFSSGRSLAAILQAWNLPPKDDGNQIPLLLVVEPVATLIQNRQFHTVTVQSSRSWQRRPTRFNWLSDAADLQKFHDMLKRAEACSSPQPGSMPIDLASIAGIANHLRRWSQAILLPREGEDEDHDNPDRMLLRNCVLQLDNLKWQQEGGGVMQRRPHGKGRQFTGSELVNSIRLMMQLRNRSNLPFVINRALEICMPTLSAECRLACQKLKAPSPATVSKLQHVFDAALLLLQEETLEEACALYIWADSSPQATYDFLMTIVVAIRLDKLREAFELAKSLANAKYSPDLPEETAPQVLEERADLSRRLRVIMVFITLMPQCMGLGGRPCCTRSGASCICFG